MIRSLLLAVLLLAFILPGTPSVAADAPGTIGVQVVPISSGELAVLHVIAGSPAAKGGLHPGDVIVEVDGKKMKGSDFDLVTRKYLWGRVGAKVTLAWLRPGVTGLHQAELTRVAVTNDMKIKPTPGVRIKPPQ